MSKDKVLYVFLDESGNFDFSKNGTQYFILTGLSCYRPFEWYSNFIDLKFDLLENSKGIERFHCTEDKQLVRDKVFSILNEHQQCFKIDSVVVQKNKTNPKIRDTKKFYPFVLKTLLSHIVKNYNKDHISKMIFITDELSIKRDREAIIKGIKTNLDKSLVNKSYNIFHWSSKSTVGLQAVDYACWAIQKKWHFNDLRSYNLIKRSIHSEFDLFRNGKTNYY